MIAISVIIPAFNEEEHLAQCLNVLVSQLLDGDEIIVVDNNSTDGTAEIARQFNIRTIKEKKQGISFARNSGFSAAKNEILARTDADSIVSVNWLGTIRDFYNKKGKEGTAITGPVYLKEPQPLRLGLHSGITKRVLGYQNLVGSNMALHRSLWSDIASKLSNDDKKYAEDTEISGQIINHGGKIEFLPEMKVVTSWRWMKKNPLKNYLQWKKKLNNTNSLLKK